VSKHREESELRKKYAEEGNMKRKRRAERQGSIEMETKQDKREQRKKLTHRKIKRKDKS
jgi:hypothetical protein